MHKGSGFEMGIRPKTGPLAAYEFGQIDSGICRHCAVAFDPVEFGL